MKITGSKIFEINIPVIGHEMIKGGGIERGAAMVAIVLKLETDEGVAGWGEVAHYPREAAQIKSILSQTLSQLINEDPTDIDKVNDLLDEICPFIPHVRSVVDIACWDIFGKVCNVPLYKLFGGKRQASVPVYYCSWHDTPENQRKSFLRGKKDGYTMFQCKVGSDPEESERCVRACAEVLDSNDILMVDPNTAMSPHQLTRTLELLKHVDFMLEQPCPSMNSCDQICKQAGRKLVLDENMTDVNAIIKSHQEKVGEVITLKVMRFGGLTRTRQARDLAVRLDRSMEIECCAGLEIITAAVAHLAISTPVRNLFASFDLAYYHEMSIAEGLPQSKNARMSCPEGPGLGIIVHEEKLGKPIFEI